MRLLKSLLFLFFISLTLTVLGQNPLSHSNIIEADSISKEQLFIKVHQSFASIYNSAEDVIQLSDQDAGLIVGKAIMNFSTDAVMLSSFDGSINYTIKAYIKDNRFKIELTDFVHSGKGIDLGLITNEDEYSGRGMYINSKKKAWKMVRQECDDFSQLIFTSIMNQIKDSESEWEF